MQLPNTGSNPSNPVTIGSDPDGRFNWKKISLWMVGGIVLILLLLWFSRTGTFGLGEGPAEAYYGSFKQLGSAQEAKYILGSSLNRMFPQTMTMSDGKILFYQDAYDLDWRENFNILEPNGDLANGCVVPKLYTFDPTTQQFASNYDQVKIVNPLLAQARLLPNDKLFVLGHAVPTGWCLEGKSLPAYEWKYGIDFSATTYLAMVYDLKTGEAGEAKIANPPIAGMNRIIGELTTSLSPGPNSYTTGLSASSPMILDLPNRGLLISTVEYKGSGQLTHTYIYDYKKNNLSLYQLETNLPALEQESEVLLLKDGRSLVYDYHGRALKLFNPKTLKVEQSHPARLGVPKAMSFWQLDSRWVLAWEEHPNADRVELPYGSNPSTLYLYNIKTNQLYQRGIEDWPLTQYANQVPGAVDDHSLLSELLPKNKRFRLWPVASGVLLVASLSYQNLPWSFGLFAIDTLEQLSVANIEDSADLKPANHFMGETSYLQNIQFPIELSNHQILFFSSWTEDNREYLIYNPNSKSTSFQLRHAVTDLSGWEEIATE
ncbi:hypothetical protein A2810_01240 [candidate division Kazan bacterium RIFCSPHIGHO2_01_FULL_49_10]|uniref:Uncharacterized protein n=1 Tax=candidate division Kazan bacterium RIFCSPLOWO2_01_FULL_48_13 TaxID=1798539 RepID=A0A1F4PR14_UNCK3|nr:MAG: hypothetical protein A2810_01240 [candidate division Kazan bacterium RIFCSPHIGHO2_01_FULL_49_10]OGB85482.1 MAG: hypothetical protein A2994_01445 [candidate division Kazan bacterium RIFCSPLOWO2_01_FULL_48_13]